MKDTNFENSAEFNLAQTTQGLENSVKDFQDAVPKVDNLVASAEELAVVIKEAQERLTQTLEGIRDTVEANISKHGESNS